MAEVGISEFTFGYAFLYEQTQANWGNLRAAPILPSLRQEQEEGWDAQLPLTGTDFYYQFKLSDYLSRGNALYLKDGTYDGGYYRFWLHKRNSNQQHRRLRQHCASNPNTYYVAPEFGSFEDFNTSFLAKQVTTKSRIIALTDCPDVNDNSWHCITFQRADPSWILHSEPQRFEKSFTGRELEMVYRQSTHQWHSITRDFAAGLFERTREIARKVIEDEVGSTRRFSPLLDEAPVERDRRHLLLRTADILSATLGVTLVLVGATE